MTLLTSIKQNCIGIGATFGIPGLGQNYKNITVSHHDRCTWYLDRLILANQLEFLWSSDHKCSSVILPEPNIGICDLVFMYATETMPMHFGRWLVYWRSWGRIPRSVWLLARGWLSTSKPLASMELMGWCCKLRIKERYRWLPMWCNMWECLHILLLFPSWRCTNSSWSHGWYAAFSNNHATCVFDDPIPKHMDTYLHVQSFQFKKTIH